MDTNTAGILFVGILALAVVLIVLITRIFDRLDR